MELFNFQIDQGSDDHSIIDHFIILCWLQSILS